MPKECIVRQDQKKIKQQQQQQTLKLSYICVFGDLLLDMGPAILSVVSILREYSIGEI